MMPNIFFLPFSMVAITERHIGPAIGGNFAQLLALMKRGLKQNNSSKLLVNWQRSRGSVGARLWLTSPHPSLFPVPVPLPSPFLSWPPPLPLHLHQCFLGHIFLIFLNEVDHFDFKSTSDPKDKEWYLPVESTLTK